MTDPVFGKPDADGWYEWKGNHMGRPAGAVEVMLRASPNCVPIVRSAEELDWSVDGHTGDIVKWRPAQ